MDVGPARLLGSPLVFQVGAEPHFPRLERFPIPPNFYLPHVGVGPASSTSPTLYQSHCAFSFNSIVVGLPFGLISGSSE